MERISKDILCVTGLYQITKIHNADGIRNMFNYRKVMRNEQICKSSVLLKLF